MNSWIPESRFHRRTLMALVAALIAVMSVLGASAQEDLPPVELSWYIIGWPVENLDMVEARFNELIQPRINATVDLRLIDWSQYTERMRVVANSGEQCDMMMLAPEWNPASPLVANGALMPLDELLPEYAPQLWSSMPPEMWDAARVNGQIYGVINQGNQARAYGIWLRVDLMEKYGFDPETADSYDDLEVLLQAISENEDPPLTLFSVASAPHGRLWFPNAWGVDALGSPAGTLGLRINGDDLQVLPAAELEEYRQAVEMAHRWYEAGYFPVDPPPSGDAIARRSEGLVTGMIWYRIPGLENRVRYGEYGGREIRQLALSEPVMTTESVTGSMTGICATSPNPERALMLLELVNTDPELIATLVYGAEGEHWVWADRDQNLITLPEGKTAEEVNASYRAPDWEFGNKFIVPYADPSELGSHEVMRELNETATASPALGFVADYSVVRNEFAQVQAAHQQYCDPLERGMVDVEQGLADCQAALEAAGIDTLVAEVQRQLDEWYASLSM